MTIEPFLDLIDRMTSRRVRYVVIGLAGANYYARSASQLFVTQDRDLFLPGDARNLLDAWNAGKEAGYQLWAGKEPLGEPIDEWLAARISSHRAGTTAIHPDGVEVDFSLAMAGFDFERVWNARRTFRVEEREIPVARLSHIVESKAHADRPKDRLFLATYEELLQKMLEDED